MYEKREISLAGDLKNNLHGYSVLKKLKHNSSFLKCGLCVITFFQRLQYGGGESTNIV